MYINQSDIPNLHPHVKNEVNNCGVACILMILGHFNIKTKTYEILKYILENDGYIVGVGLKHSTIFEILKQNKIKSYTKDCNRKKVSKKIFFDGIEMIKEKVNNDYFYIASVMRNFEPNAESTHLVLIKKYINDDFIVDDPDHVYGSENRIIPEEDFISSWRGLGIFVKK